MRLSASFFDAGWGDRTGRGVYAITVAKFVVAFGIALGLHEMLVWAVLSPSPQRIVSLQSTIDNATAKQSFRICLVTANRVATDGCKAVAASFDGPIDSYRYLLGYVVRQRGAANGPSKQGTFVGVKKVSLLFGLSVSHPEIEDSIDVLMRKIEVVGFGTAGQTPSAASLCFGSRKALEGTGCKVTDELRKALDAAGSIGGLLRQVRVKVLFFGPIQCLTLLIFTFSMIQTFGLYQRWVTPVDTLLEVEEFNGDERVKNRSSDELMGAVKGQDSLGLVSIGDRLFRRVIQSLRNVENATDAEKETIALHTLTGYRDFLVEDATVKQDLLEVLGDSMLKVAFMGTVYGISAALFAARELDAADPLIRLEAKSHMYAGIGVGFGATLVGIALSILAATTRAWLMNAWFAKISRAYRVLLEFAKHAPNIPEDVGGGVPLPPEQSIVIRAIEAVGLIVVLGIVVYVCYLIVAPNLGIG